MVVRAQRRAGRPEREQGLDQGRTATGPFVDPSLRLEVVARLPIPSEDEAWWDDRAVRGAIDLLMASGTAEGLAQAETMTARWVERRPGPASWSVRSSVLRESARRGLGGLEPTLAALDAAIAFDPCEPRRHLERAEVLVELGRCDEAVSAVDEAARLDAQHELDPLVQLGDRDRRRLADARAACESDQSARP